MVTHNSCLLWAPSSYTVCERVAAACSDVARALRWAVMESGVVVHGWPCSLSQALHIAGVPPTRRTQASAGHWQVCCRRVVHSQMQADSVMGDVKHPSNMRCMQDAAAVKAVSAANLECSLNPSFP